MRYDRQLEEWKVDLEYSNSDHRYKTFDIASTHSHSKSLQIKLIDQQHWLKKVRRIPGIKPNTRCNLTKPPQRIILNEYFCMNIFVWTFLYEYFCMKLERRRPSRAAHTSYVKNETNTIGFVQLNYMLSAIWNSVYV